MASKIYITPHEQSTGITSPSTVQKVVEAYRTNGFVILVNAIDSEIVRKLDAKMQADVQVKLADPELVFNQGVAQTNFSILPPLEKEFLFESVWANKHAAAWNISLAPAQN